MIDILVNRILTQKKRMAQQEVFVLGIHGPQGSGKSTLSKTICESLMSANIRAVRVSQDDFYLGKAQRQKLAKKIHPLLAHRGVPGTHDLPLALSIFRDLKVRQPVEIPVFDKAADDLFENDQSAAVGPVDVIVLEGWCVGLPDQLHQELQDNPQPVNEREAKEDADSSWRLFVAESNRLYQPWYEMIDYLVGLKVPSFDCVAHWRWQQECELFEKTGQRYFNSEAEIRDFISCFERVTRWAQQHLNEFVDCTIQIDKQHRMTGMYENK